VARSVWKNKFFTKSVWSTILDIHYKKSLKKLKKLIYSRNSSIPYCFINTRVYVHKGNSSKKLTINRNVVGYKFGEFSFTKKPFYYPKKDPKKKTKKR